MTAMQLRAELFREMNPLLDSESALEKMLPFGACVDTFAKERARLWDAGKPIEDFDLLIGCTAKAVGLTMVTHNAKHFSHIEGLEIEDWVK